MDRRCVCVCTTVVLLLLTLSHSSSAGTARKPSVNKRSASISRPRPTRARSRKPTARVSRATKRCARCEAEVARKNKGRATAKRAKNTVSLPCHSKDYVNPRIAKNYKAAMRDMRRAGIRPRVTSVWRSSVRQAELHRCSISTRCRRSNPGLYRALPAGRSIHEAGFAVDIAGVAKGPRGAKRVTPQGRRIIAIMKKNGFNWRYGLADPVHFEADPRKYGYRSVREAITRTQTTCQVRLAKGKARKKPVNKIAASRARGPARLRLSSHAGASKTRGFVAKAAA